MRVLTILQPQQCVSKDPPRFRYDQSWSSIILLPPYLASLTVLEYHKYLGLVGVVDDFLQPYDIRMMDLLEDGNFFTDPKRSVIPPKTALTRHPDRIATTRTTNIRTHTDSRATSN